MTYGTPPHLQRSTYNVPAPTIEHFASSTDGSHDTSSHGGDGDIVGAASVFVALYTLSEVLDHYLQHIYTLDPEANGSSVRSLKFRLNSWVESLEGEVRKIIVRGTRLCFPGAANLRLAYLSVQLLQQRIELDFDRDRARSGSEDDTTIVSNQYISARRTAEDVVHFIQELEEKQLGDFWLSVSAFALSSTVTFLFRCALVTENSPGALAQSPSLKLARDLIDSLRQHRDTASWDLGDLCLAQHSEVVERLMTPELANDSLLISSYDDLGVPDASLISELFPSLWDTFQPS